MENQSFWLADIGDHNVTVSYINVDQGATKVNSIGPPCPWDESNPESFNTALDQSLSESAISANLSQDAEPNVVAIIVPPFWVGSDGKIISPKRKLLESMFKRLELKPMGFIANDEAIVEAANIADGFPASFVLVNISATDLVVSLTYLGKITERIHRDLAGTFDPELLESAILEFKSESALPPQIILFGQVDEAIFESVKNYSWIGKKNVETFLHFPDVKIHTSSELIQIFTHAITSQFSTPVNSPPLPKPVDLEPEIEVSIPEVEVEISPEVGRNLPIELSEVSPSELGFTNEISQDEANVESVEESNFTVPESFPEIIETINEPVIVKKNNPKISLPKISFNFQQFILYPIIFSPILILIPFFFSTAHITLYLTPYQFNKTISATFDPQAQSIDFTKKIIPINRQEFTVSTSSTIATTGQKTIGDKAKGEITIFNNQDKVQNIPSGTVLIDSQGDKYQIDNNLQVPIRKLDLTQGIITLGQVKATATAADIGPEYNLAKDAAIHFKDFAESLLVAKANDNFVGGSKKQINAVSAAEKSQLDTKITTDINLAVKSKLDSEIAKNSNIIRDTVQIQKGHIDYNREIGEEADQLTGTAISKVYVFFLDSSKKIDLINDVLASETGYSDSIIDASQFNFSITPSKASIDKISGQLTISGTALPKVDSASIIKMLSGKFQNQAIKIIKNNIPRVYNYSLTTNFAFLKAINPLPLRLKNIIIDFK